MKLSIAISILILAAAAGLGWRDRQQLAAIREHHAKLVAEAATLGISLDPENTTHSIRITKRERVNHEVDAKLATAEFIAFAREIEVIRKNGGAPDEVTQKRILDLIDRMMSLDSAQLRILIAEVRAAKDLNDETRQDLISFSIMQLASDHPQAALALFTESSDLFKDNGMDNQVVFSSLSRWAKDDPAGALEWALKNGEKFPALVTDDAMRGLISGAAVNDPKFAFQLIGNQGFKNSSQTISGIISAAKTPEQRTAILAELREYVAILRTSQEVTSVKSMMGSFSQSLAQEGFAAATQWIAGANFTPDELGGLAPNLAYSIKSGETGQWIEWIGEKLPPEQADYNIRNMVSNWTQNDYQAAGKWLTATPAGPTRNIAISSYAATISSYEPQTAAQWAMTLPPGKEREETLKSIHSNWPEGDDDAKEAFAKAHGIK